MRQKYNTPHRTHIVKTRLDDDEYELFQKQCAAYGISQAEMIRQSLTRLQIKPVIHVSVVDDKMLAAIGDLTAAYGKIGGNLNQIARFLNECGAPYNALSSEVRAAKSLFLSSMSHDLRTPLNGILGFAKLAAEESDPLLKQDYLTKIRSSGDLLLSLVNDTLELSRIESGKMTLDAKAIDSHELIETVIAAVKPSADQKNIRLLTDFSAFPFGWVCVDRSKVQKILLNLLSNAVKYTPAGGTVSFSVSLSEPSQGPCNGHIVIEDTGIGMSEEFLSRLYEPFTQEHRMGPDAADGTGLGLSIVKKTVDFLGGSICVDSKINLGTRFTVDLPMPPADGIDPTSAQSEQDAVVLQGKRVLLCEDNQINTEIAVLLLKKHGILTDCAPNGKAGFELYASAPAGTYDAVLLDIRMPVMDGYDTARAIRSFPREDAASIPIIAMTADAFENDVKKCSEAGMNDHIPKPIDPALLEQALKKAFAKPPQA
ncbi:ATP-binding protein [Acidaminobacterium chupaoyuni]